MAGRRARSGSGRRARCVVALAAAVSAAAGLAVVVTTAGPASAAAPRPHGAVAVLVAATAAGGTGGTRTTSAATPVGGSGPRTRLEHALARRQAVLSKLTSSVGQSGALSTAVRQTLQAQLAAETSGIDGLASAVPGDANPQLAPAATAMVDQYRVYLVMVPKVRLAEQAARQLRAESKATAAEASLASRIDVASKAGTTVQAAEQADTDLVAKVGAAASDTQGAGIAAVLAVAPAGYPGDKGPITAARKELRSARSLLPPIRSDLQTIRTAVRGSASGS